MLYGTVLLWLPYSMETIEQTTNLYSSRDNTFYSFSCVPEPVLQSQHELLVTEARCTNELSALSLVATVGLDMVHYTR